MEFDEVQEGEYRIFVGALDAPGAQGFIAAAVVSKTIGKGMSPQEVWRDDSMACGYRWPNAEAAMSYAMHRARDVIRKGHAVPPASGPGGGTPASGGPGGSANTAAANQNQAGNGNNPVLRLRAA